MFPLGCEVFWRVAARIALCGAADGGGLQLPQRLRAAGGGAEDPVPGLHAVPGRAVELGGEYLPFAMRQFES